MEANHVVQSGEAESDRAFSASGQDTALTTAFRRGATAMREAAITRVLNRIDELSREMDATTTISAWDRLFLFFRKQEAEYIIAVHLDIRALSIPAESPAPANVGE